MAKFCGKIGYSETIAPTEDNPGVWTETITERGPYYGDILTNTRRLDQSKDSTIDDIRVTNRLSILADPYALQNFMRIKYVIFNGMKLKVPTVDVEYPRLVLTLGGPWNE